jgi:hypothetical protein
VLTTSSHYPLNYQTTPHDACPEIHYGAASADSPSAAVHPAAHHTGAARMAAGHPEVEVVGLHILAVRHTVVDPRLHKRVVAVRRIGAVGWSRRVQVVGLRRRWVRGGERRHREAVERRIVVEGRFGRSFVVRIHRRAVVVKIHHMAVVSSHHKVAAKSHHMEVAVAAWSRTGERERHTLTDSGVCWMTAEEEPSMNLQSHQAG